MYHSEVANDFIREYYNRLLLDQAGLKLLYADSASLFHSLEGEPNQLAAADESAFDRLHKMHLGSKVMITDVTAVPAGLEQIVAVISGDMLSMDESEPRSFTQVLVLAKSAGGGHRIVSDVMKLFRHDATTSLVLVSEQVPPRAADQSGAVDTVPRIDVPASAGSAGRSRSVSPMRQQARPQSANANLRQGKNQKQKSGQPFKEASPKETTKDALLPQAGEPAPQEPAAAKEQQQKTKRESEQSRPSTASPTEISPTASQINMKVNGAKEDGFKPNLDAKLPYEKKQGKAKLENGRVDRGRNSRQGSVEKVDRTEKLSDLYQNRADNKPVSGRTANGKPNGKAEAVKAEVAVPVAEVEKPDTGKVDTGKADTDKLDSCKPEPTVKDNLRAKEGKEKPKSDHARQESNRDPKSDGQNGKNIRGRVDNVKVDKDPFKDQNKEPAKADKVAGKPEKGRFVRNEKNDRPEKADSAEKTDRPEKIDKAAKADSTREDTRPEKPTKSDKPGKSTQSEAAKSEPSAKPENSGGNNGGSSGEKSLPKKSPEPKFKFTVDSFAKAAKFQPQSQTTSAMHSPQVAMPSMMPQPIQYAPSPMYAFSYPMTFPSQGVVMGYRPDVIPPQMGSPHMNHQNMRYPQPNYQRYQPHQQYHPRQHQNYQSNPPPS